MSKNNRFYLLLILHCMVSFTSIQAQDLKLPDLGTPSDSILSPVKEAEIRDQIVKEIYQYDLAIFDPFVADYIENLGYKISAQSNKPNENYDFFVINQKAINASTYPGGLIIFFSGLILESDTESEVAAVMAHEVAHATQRHISRSYANASKNTIPTLLGLVGAALASRHSDSDDAPIAIATATMAMQQQAMINFTRENEYEADRIGIQILSKAGFNTEGMASFFEKLMRYNPVDQRYQTNEYLRTHPLSVNRVAEAKNRISSLPSNKFSESNEYSFIKERLRVLTKNNELEHTQYYENLFKKGNSHEQITNAHRYGYALSLHHSQNNVEALKVLDTISKKDSETLIVRVLYANILSHLNRDRGIQTFENLRSIYPENPKVIIPYVKALLKSEKFDNYLTARTLARQLTQSHPYNPNYFQLLAVVNQNANKPIEANEALAMKEHLINNNYRAVRVLKNLLKSDLNYYQRARIEARITEFESLITDEERRREKLADRLGRVE